MVEFTFQHSLQFQDRSLDADSSGLPNTVEDVDVEDSALENSLASSYWFRACEETGTNQRNQQSTQANQVVKPQKSVESEQYSASAQQQYLLMEGPCHSVVLFCNVRFFCNLLPNSKLQAERKVHFFTTYQLMPSIVFIVLVHVTSEFAT